MSIISWTDLSLSYMPRNSGFIWSALSIVILSSCGIIFASLSVSAYGKSSAFPTDFITPRAAIVPNVTICVTESCPYFSWTYSMALYLSAYSKSTSISGIDTRSGLRNLSKSRLYLTGSISVIPVQ